MALWPLAARAADATYTVQPGDNLFGIARRTGVEVSAIVAANHITNPNVLYVGQTLIIPGKTAPAPAPTTATPAASSDGVYLVQAGDTLSGLAQKFGVSIFDLAAANNISVVSYVYVGQTLRIPGHQAPVSAPATVVPTAPAAPTPAISPSGTYTVQAGDSLSRIAQKTGVSVDTLVALNHLANANYIYVGQVLALNGKGVTSLPVTAATPVPAVPAAGAGAGSSAATTNTSRDGKWIDVNLSQQRLTAYVGSQAVFTSLASTGVAIHPTVVGTFNIQRKLRYDEMIGPGYDLPNVPYTMYFYGGYAIHGTYWHHNFGHPMSHGCVNLPTDAAGFMYNWAPLGTPVYIHY